MEGSFKVYAIVFANGNLYIGMTGRLRQRINDHLRGHTKTTKNRKIIKVYIVETCPNRIVDRAREKYWKSGCGKEFLKSKIFRARSSGG